MSLRKPLNGYLPGVTQLLPTHHLDNRSNSALPTSRDTTKMESSSLLSNVQKAEMPLTPWAQWLSRAAYVVAVGTMLRWLSVSYRSNPIHKMQRNIIESLNLIPKSTSRHVMDESSIPRTAHPVVQAHGYEYADLHCNFNPKSTKVTQ